MTLNWPQPPLSHWWSTGRWFLLRPRSVISCRFGEASLSSPIREVWDCSPACERHINSHNGWGLEPGSAPSLLPVRSAPSPFSLKPKLKNIPAMAANRVCQVSNHPSSWCPYITTDHKWTLFIQPISDNYTQWAVQNEPRTGKIYNINTFLKILGP